MDLRLPNSIERFPQRGEFRPSVWISYWIHKGLPEHAAIALRVRWPIYLAPLAVVNQLLTPHPVWIVLFVALAGLYGSAVFWVRAHARHVKLEHRRLGEMLLVGDTFREEFEIHNGHFLPVLWSELIDYSRFPKHNPGQVVACGGHNHYRWRRDVPCRQRGVYRLGPYGLRMSDPFGLLDLSLFVPKEEYIVIYPRVVAMPQRKFPHGQSTGADRRRRNTLGVTPGYSVLEYQPGDSLRRIHWRVTAHRGQLMVRELETEPTGDIWIVLDLYGAAHRGEGQLGTLEFSITAAASLAGALLAGNEGRAVGLLVHSGAPEAHIAAGLEESPFSDMVPIRSGGAVKVRPKPGPGQLWQILTALAPVEAGTVPLAQVLSGSRELFGPRSTLVVITPHVTSLVHANGSAPADPDGFGGSNTPMSDEPSDDVEWPAELLHLRSGGFDGHAMLITPSPESLDEPNVLEPLEAAAERLQELLLGQRVQTDRLQASEEYVPAVTYRRRKTVVRSTPTGGVATFEVEEEVG